MIRKTLFAACAAIVVTLLSACASFPQDRLAAVGSLPDVSAYQHKPRVFVDLKFFHGEPGKETPVDITASVRKDLQPLVEGVLADSKLFEAVTFDSAQEAQTDATVQFYYYNYGSGGAAFASGFLTGFTFGVIPGAGTDQYALQTKVVQRDGRESPMFTNNDAIRTWVGLWFIPVAGHTPKKAFAKVVTNMTRDALQHMVIDKQLMYSSLLAPGEATIAP